MPRTLLSTEEHYLHPSVAWAAAGHTDLRIRSRHREDTRTHLLQGHCVSPARRPGTGHSLGPTVVARPIGHPTVEGQSRSHAHSRRVQPSLALHPVHRRHDCHLRAAPRPAHALGDLKDRRRACVSSRHPQQHPPRRRRCLPRAQPQVGCLPRASELAVVVAAAAAAAVASFPHVAPAVCAPVLRLVGALLDSGCSVRGQPSSHFRTQCTASSR